MKSGESWRQQREKQNRIAAHSTKWHRANKIRANMTDDEIASEEAALIEEASIMAASLGLDDQHIGDRWSRKEGLDLQTEGTGE